MDFHFLKTSSGDTPDIDTEYTVTILSFRTDRSGQSVQTQIRLLLEDALLYDKAILFKF